MILLRTTRLDTGVHALADRLRLASGERVAMLVDERRGSAGETDYPKIGLTDAECRAMRLHTPRDFAWRCGDYGLYLARARVPDESFYWMIEYDVRISGDASAFFRACAERGEVDLLTSHFRPAGGDWWWHATVTSSDARAHRCFFPVCRFSARAVDALLEKRRAQSRRPLRRALWPNDESFVATAAANAGFAIADFNDLGPFYDDATFSYEKPIDGDDFEPRGSGPRLHHPVLLGEDYRRKLQRLRDDHGKPTPVAERAYRKLIARLNGLTKW